MKSFATCLFAIALAATVAAGQLVPLDSPEREARWRPLFEKMAAKGAIRSEFTERRWLSYRKEPVELEGELRFLPSRGLSLHYTSPEDQTVIIDDRGFAMRDSKGRTRSIHANGRALAFNQTMLAVMSFDFDQLLRDFSIAASRDGARWTMQLTPHDKGVARTLGTLFIEGVSESITRLEFKRSERQRVEIVVGRPETGITFPEAELERFFR